MHGVQPKQTKPDPSHRHPSKSLAYRLPGARPLGRGCQAERREEINPITMMIRPPTLEKNVQMLAKRKADRGCAGSSD